MYWQSEASPLDETIEIRDPGMDAAAFYRRIEAQVAQRRAKGSYAEALARLAALPEVAAPTPGRSEFPGLRDAVIELSLNSSLEEPTFQSSAPIVGPLVVAVRRGWNWMSTKWYVLPIIRRQSLVNAEVSSVIGQMAQWAELKARQTEELRSRVAELEARVAELERR